MRKHPHSLGRAAIEDIVRQVTREYLERDDAPRVDTPEAAIFYSPEAEAVKAEICAVGRKLWERMYVDGNGGNISCRIGPNAVICTPTLVSKADLTPADLCLVDLEGNQIVGAHHRTSETYLHLEVYKAVPEARAAVHCHPPHATAYAVTGQVPPSNVIPEYEVFVGRVALAPYDTPGTREFARTILPFVRQHNTILLANHGIICWADTVTHAEWCAEVVDTYCWTVMLAAQLGAPLTRIPPEKVSLLLAIKKRLGLPDVRLDPQGARQADPQKTQSARKVDPRKTQDTQKTQRAQPRKAQRARKAGPQKTQKAQKSLITRRARTVAPSEVDVDALVKSITGALVGALRRQ
jgi:L-fuculose-phosphate aldolase